MRASRLVLAIMLAHLFVGLLNEVAAQGTIQPKDDAQPVFTSPGTDDAPPAVPAPAAPGGVQVLRAETAPDGFTLLNSGTIRMDDLKINLQPKAPAYGGVHADLVKIEKDLNDALEKIRQRLNKYIEEQVDPTLQLKDPNSSQFSANDKLIEGIEKESASTQKEIDKLFNEARAKIPQAFSKCPSGPPPEPAPCNALQAPNLGSLQTNLELVKGRVEKWESVNVAAVKNPTPYIGQEENQEQQNEWGDATKGAQKYMEDTVTKEGGEAAGEVTGETDKRLGDMERVGVNKQQ
jgi:hypothetical protein